MIKMKENETFNSYYSVRYFTYNHSYKIRAQVQAYIKISTIGYVWDRGRALILSTYFKIVKVAT